ncbi:protein translocase subunit SecD [Azospirillum halopraeferens]|uniref:protein translocase subunit SecD n=1 Tax=Azospirillum halopraeferens TaxID=34010 RepID=UPI000409CE40|nr:protein translocase subunit SecD [Azospirillum halopraeferens]
MRTPRWRLVTYAVILLVGILAALPNLLSPRQLAALPSWLPAHPVTLGLDLKGGSHLVLEVDAAALVAERVGTLATDARAALREAGIAVRSAGTEGNTVVIDLGPGADGAAALSAIRPLLPPREIEAARPAPGRLVLTLTEAGVRERVDAAVAQSLEIVRRRIDQVGVAEPTIQRVGSDRILVQLPGVQDPSHLRELLGSTAKMGFHLLARSPSGPGVVVLPDRDGRATYPVERRVALDGDHLVDARAAFDPQTHEPIVTFRFDGPGSRRFADITRENVGRPFAIVLDGKVLSAPVIREPITGGSGRISGAFTVADTAVLSALLRAGALPAPLTVIEERTVGPDLGGDAIAMGVTTGLVGFALVFGFMVLLYGWWGMVANLALGLNVALTFGALGLLGATLTLPGIAGIILGIGLAVDANVLINERIREETRKGRGALSALGAGFDRAYATIVDSNLTALIATALLFQFGTGPVRGFAVTMALGIAISMFTAVSVVRIIMTEIVRRRRLKTLRIEPLVRLFPDGTAIRFMRARFLGIGLSLLLSAASVALFLHPGPNYGVDFRGGIQMEVATPGHADIGALRERLGALGLGEAALQAVDGGRGVLVRMERQPGGEAAQTRAVERMRDAIAEANPAASVVRTEVVGPKVSAELAESGVLAVVLASLAMLAYIWWRFEWPFAVGAIATLVLDVTKTVGFFALTGIDFNLTAIAALLTLIGYSVNDKVVVYDRMRENMRLYKAMPFRELIDLSINQTLGRSLYTSVTAFLAMLPMAVWGGGAVESFAVPMVFGILVAASSSVFIAAPILLFLGDWRNRRAAGRPAGFPIPATLPAGRHPSE